MKRLLLPLLMPLILLTGCLKDSCESTYKIYIPVFKSLSEVRAGIRSEAPQPLRQTGKLYTYGQYVFLNEINQGVHIIDNSDPRTPRNIAFVPIPGNVDIAVRGSFLYADCYGDLVTLDISNPADVRKVSIQSNVFEDRRIYYWMGGYGSAAANPDSIRVPVDYIVKDTMVDCATYSSWRGRNCPNCMFFDAGGGRALALAAPTGGVKTGKGGSMARFAITENRLYTVTAWNLKTFGLGQTDTPQLRHQQSFNRMNAETIYPFKGNLFIGSTTGMMIYDLVNPDQPAARGIFTHARSCDPVIADDKHAYVTLRSGTLCNNGLNQLDVLDIANIDAPKLLKSFPFQNPHGLSKDGDVLLVCDGAFGLKVYDASAPLNLKLLDEWKDLECFDVIAEGGRALVVGRDGLYQVDYTNPRDLKLISRMAIQN